MVGSDDISFWGKWPIFRGKIAVSFREGSWLFRSPKIPKKSIQTHPEVWSDCSPKKTYPLNITPQLRHQPTSAHQFLLGMVMKQLFLPNLGFLGSQGGWKSQPPPIYFQQKGWVLGLPGFHGNTAVEPVKITPFQNKENHLKHPPPLLGFNMFVLGGSIHQKNTNGYLILLM